MLILFFLFSFCSLFADSNVLIYTDPVQVTSSINAYETIVAGAPIEGSVMITHDTQSAVDTTSFRLGDKPLQVQFVESMSMSSYSSLVVTIYHFQLAALPPGSHTLPPIKVKVGGKEYQAPPMTVQVPR
jgi:hypothetical protein